MQATYYAGTKGKESIPVILLHGFDSKEGRKEIKHSRKDFEQGLAPYLQSNLGFAVIVPDLRGYGESIKLKRNGNETEKLDDKRTKLDEIREKKRADELKKKLQSQLAEMVTEDLRAVKSFLWKKNNAKALNIDKLTVIGVEEGAILALSYAAFDAVGYEEGEARVGPLKLGKFVKAVVLVSPASRFKGLTALQATKLPREDPICRVLPVMIVVGNKSKDRFAEAERLPTCSRNRVRPKTT